MAKFDFTALLKNEIRPALGCTEVGAVALAAARAYAAVGGTLLHIKMTMNGGMYKNAFSCAIPGTAEYGCDLAAALGAYAGNWELGLEVLEGVTDEHVAQLRAMELPVETGIDKEKENIYIEAEVTTTLQMNLLVKLQSLAKLTEARN